VREITQETIYLGSSILVAFGAPDRPKVALAPTKFKRDVAGTYPNTFIKGGSATELLLFTTKERVLGKEVNRLLTF